MYRGLLTFPMPRSHWDDDYWDDDEFPTMRSSRSSGVVVAAVFTFLMAGFNALSASCLLLCGLVFAFLDQANQQQGGFLPADFVRHSAIITVFFGIVSLAILILQICVGIALLRTRRWARLTSFYLAAYSLAICGLMTYLIHNTLTSGHPDDEERAITLATQFVIFAIHLGYALTVFVLLLPRHVARQFR